MKRRSLNLDETDHRILLGLINGLMPDAIGPTLDLTRTAVASRLVKMRLKLDVQTTYQLVALEMANLMTCEQAKVEALLGRAVEQDEQAAPVKARAAMVG